MRRRSLSAALSFALFAPALGSLAAEPSLPLPRVEPAQERPEGAPAPGPADPSQTLARTSGGLAPQIVAIRPTPKDGVILVDVHRKLELIIETTDPLGEATEVEIFGRPESSTYDPGLHYLVWQPTEPGVKLPLRVVAKAGHRYSERTLLIQVIEGQAPTLHAQRLVLYSDSSGPAARIHAIAGDAQPLQFSATNLPSGLQLNAESGEVYVSGTVSEGIYEIDVTVRNDTSESKAKITVEVKNRRGNDTESYFLPGVGFAMQTTGDSEPLGTLIGPAVEILVAAWVHDNENRGPSHGRIYLRSELLKPTGLSSSLGLSYSLGFDLSLERNPARKFLIPHYGLDLGGIVQRELGHEFQTTPYLGLHLISTENLFVQARGGYRLIPARLDQFSGFHAALTLDYSVW